MFFSISDFWHPGFDPNSKKCHPMTLTATTFQFLDQKVTFLQFHTKKKILTTVSQFFFKLFFLYYISIKIDEFWIVGHYILWCKALASLDLGVFKCNVFPFFFYSSAIGWITWRRLFNTCHYNSINRGSEHVASSLISGQQCLLVFRG